MSTPFRAFAREHAAVVVLSLLLVGAVAGWVREASKPPRIVEASRTAEAVAAHPAETVRALVAARDLTTGTAFTQDNVDQLTALKDVPKVAVPAEGT